MSLNFFPWALFYAKKYFSFEKMAAYEQKTFYTKMVIFLRKCNFYPKMSLWVKSTKSKKNPKRRNRNQGHFLPKIAFTYVLTFFVVLAFATSH